MAFCSVNRLELNVESARQIVQERIPSQNSQLSIEAIQQQVAEHFGLTVNLLIGKTRKKEVVAARQISMYLAKQLTQNPLKKIGLHFGNRDHSTVIHAIQTVEKKSKSDPAYAKEIETLLESIHQRHSPS